MSRKQPNKLRLRLSEKAKIETELEISRQKLTKQLGKEALNYAIMKQAGN